MEEGSSEGGEVVMVVVVMVWRGSSSVLRSGAGADLSMTVSGRSSRRWEFMDAKGVVWRRFPVWAFATYGPLGLWDSASRMLKVEVTREKLVLLVWMFIFVCVFGLSNLYT